MRTEALDTRRGRLRHRLSKQRICLCKFNLIGILRPYDPHAERMSESMRNRNCRVEIYFTKDELETLTKKYRKTNLSREGFCRAAINTVEVKGAPPADYYGIMREVKRVGSNLDQLLKRANTAELLDVPAIRKSLGEIHDTVQMLWDTFNPNAE